MEVRFVTRVDGTIVLQKSGHGQCSLEDAGHSLIVSALIHQETPYN